MRRDFRRRRRRDRRRGAPWAMRSNIVASQVRFIASGAASCPSWRRASTSATSAASSNARLTRPRPTWRDLGAVAVTQGPGLVGSLLVGVSFAKPAAAARPAARGRPPPCGAHRVARAAERRAAAAGGRAGRVGRAHRAYLVERPGATSCSAGRVTMRRERPTTRWRSSLAWDIRADRSSIGCARRQRSRGRTADHAPDARRSQRARAQRRSRLQLQRPQDRCLASRAERQAEVPLSDAGDRDICASFQRVVVTGLLDRLFDAARRYRGEKRRHRRRRVRRTAACAPSWRSAAAAVRCRHSSRVSRSRPTTRR